MSSSPKITDYDLLEKLGAGSYATVFKARHKTNKTYHAIKVVLKSSLSNTSTDNLVTEIKLLKSLKNKFIVALDDFFWDDKKIYIVLEYCNAGNLSNFIKSRKALPETTCKYFLRQLAVAVQYMRSNDISHFDLKPQNLLLTRTANNVLLKVADFGFAQHLKLGEINFTLKGSPLYMAPEIISKQQYDATADLWSIGVILYECLFGKAPYSSKTIDELLFKIRNHERIVIPSNTRISDDCHDFLARLLQHNPKKRITFQEFFDHKFLDLKTFPNDGTLNKAISIVTKAVEHDEKGRYEEAYYLYCNALQYFVPLITEETDANKKIALRNKALAYLKRAEEIKSLSQQDSPAQTITSVLEPGVRYKQLFALSHSSPRLKNALEIGRQAELYLYEKKFESAFDAFKSALSILVPFLSNEPNGDRKTLIIQQIDFWMKEAESIQTLLSVKDIEESDEIPGPKNSSIKSCVIQ